MKFEIEMETLIEIVQCIVDCDLDRDEAVDYAMSVVTDDSEEWPDEERIDIIGHNGSTGCHYALVVKQECMRND